MSHGIILRVTHSGQNDSSVYIPDTHDGKDANGRVQNQKSAQYVPVGGYIDMVFTDQIAFSFEQGGIRGLIQGGYVTTSFIIGSTTGVSALDTTINNMTKSALGAFSKVTVNVANGNQTQITVPFANAKLVAGAIVLVTMDIPAANVAVAITPYIKTINAGVSIVLGCDVTCTGAQNIDFNVAVISA